jgi:hypothetical protein
MPTLVLEPPWAGLFWASHGQAATGQVCHCLPLASKAAVAVIADRDLAGGATLWKALIFVTRKAIELSTGLLAPLARLLSRC